LQVAKIPHFKFANMVILSQNAATSAAARALPQTLLEKLQCFLRVSNLLGECKSPSSDPTLCISGAYLPPLTGYMDTWSSYSYYFLDFYHFLKANL